MSVLIKSATLITASDTISADLLIEGEKITAIGAGLHAPEDAQVMDASGRLVLPGGVDVHTHLDLPMFGTVSSDDHYTGTRAAAFGGTTTVIDFVPQDREPLLKNVDAWNEKAQGKAAVDYGFHMNMTRFNDQVASEIPQLVREGITSLKVFTAYNNRLRLQDGDIFKVLRIASENGMLVMSHCENGDVIDILVREALQQGHTAPEWHAYTRPARGEVETIQRMISLAWQASAPVYIVHMTTRGGVEQLQRAREKNQPVMGETCPPFLFFTAEDLKRPDGAKWVCSPPVRTVDDNQGLWQALQNETLQTIATDHCPFFFDGTQPILFEGKSVAIPGKELGLGDFTKIPNGLPGVGDRLPVLWTTAVGTGRLSPNQFVALTSTNPAKIFGLYPQKGSLMPGADADLVIWDPDKKIKYGVAVAQHRTDYNLYEGWELKGFIDQVFLRGNLIVDHQQWKGRSGQGRFISRSTGQVI
jgi:dihydropyrimidinase